MVLFKQVEPLPVLEQNQLNLLRSYISKLDAVCVAYSGGVDSTLVAAISLEQLGFNAIAVTGVSPALAPHLLKEAKHQAAWIGIQHHECITNELDDPAYRNNPDNRCFACKQELHKELAAITTKAKGMQVIDGVNRDDLDDHRPGIKAATLAGVSSPLAELEIRKDSIRRISRALGFPWWDKPAQPCLASRVPYGETIDATRLNRIGEAEAWLKKYGFNRVRVRTYGLTASIEVPAEAINDLMHKIDRQKLINYFLGIGFTAVSIDLEGLISGKLNRNKAKSSSSQIDASNLSMKQVYTSEETSESDF